MSKFQGFNDSETFTPIPDSFFRQLLPEVEDLDELKVTLHAVWRIANMEGPVHYLREGDFSDCLPAQAGKRSSSRLASALKKAVDHSSLIAVEGNKEILYFLNSPRGRAAAEAFSKGQWQPDAGGTSAALPGRPNIFKLYEENIGLLTPLVADALKDAEQTYPPAWVAEALEIAVLQNKRNWKYVEAILKRWKEEGHAKKQDRRDVDETRGRDVTRKVEDFLKR